MRCGRVYLQDNKEVAGTARVALIRRGFVVAGFAAGLAVHESVLANANVDDRLAKNAVLFALADVFQLLALHTAILDMSGSGAHAATVARAGGGAERDGGNGQGSGARGQGTGRALNVS